MATWHRTHKTEIEAIRQYGRMTHLACYVLHQSGRLHGSAGLPDLLVFDPRTWRVAWVEVKVGRDKLTDAQKDFHSLAVACGQMVLVGGLAEVEAWHRRGAEGRRIG